MTTRASRQGSSGSGARGTFEGTNPRTLLVGDFSASREGNFSVAEDLAVRLRAREFSVTTTSSRSTSIARVLGIAIETLRQSRSIDVAVVDVYSGRAFVWAELSCALLRRAHVPYAVVLRGGNLPAFARKQPSRVRRLLSSATIVIALSQYLANDMSSYAGSFHVLPNPLDVDAYSYRPRQIAAPKLVWLRSFHETYNPSMAVRVLAGVVVSLPDATLIMVGPNRHDGAFERAHRLAVELGVSERIEFVGPVKKTEVAVQLNRGDVFLNTPRIDNVPISLLEAMACGLCVVSTRVGGIPYMVEDGLDALLVPSDDVNAMVDSVLRICGESALAHKLSTAGRVRAERHGWNLVLPRWETVLTELAHRRSTE